jgi:hypothetical protein
MTFTNGGMKRMPGKLSDREVLGLVQKHRHHRLMLNLPISTV